MTDKNQDIIDRIRKLLAMAADSSSPHEAAIAAGRARKLMDQHQITLDDLKDESTGFGYQKVDKTYRFLPMWKDILAVAIAKFNDCKCVRSHEWKQEGSKSYSYRLMFQGFTHDVAVAAAMYDYLTSTIDRLCATYMRSLNLGQSLTKISDAYKKSASSELCSRLREMQEEREASLKTSETGSGHGMSLVLYKMQQVEAEFGKAKYANKRLTTRKEAEVWNAQRQGREDAKNISLNTQIRDPDASSRAKLTHGN